MFSAIKGIEEKIIYHITDFSIKGIKDKAVWFGVTLAFDNHSKLSIPLSKVWVRIYHVKANGEEVLLATSAPIEDKYALRPGQRTELDEILISVPLQKIGKGLYNLLTLPGALKSRKFRVRAMADVAGQTAEKTEDFLK